MITNIVAAISAASGIITAVALFLNVLPKLGVHNTKLDTVTAKVDNLAVQAQQAAAEAKALAPAMAAAVVPVAAPEPAPAAATPAA